MNKCLKISFYAFLAPLAAACNAQTAFVNGDHVRNEGWVQVEDSAVHGRFETSSKDGAEGDWRKHHKAFFVDKPRLRSWASAQDEIEYKAKLLLAAQAKTDPAPVVVTEVKPKIKQAKKTLAKKARAPKVAPIRVVCVPGADKQSSIDWQGHLLCWDLMKKGLTK
jgi:hypothetical protein